MCAFFFCFFRFWSVAWIEGWTLRRGGPTEPLTATIKAERPLRTHQCLSPRSLRRSLFSLAAPESDRGNRPTFTNELLRTERSAFLSTLARFRCIGWWVDWRVDGVCAFFFCFTVAWIEGWTSRRGVPTVRLPAAPGCFRTSSITTSKAYCASEPTSTPTPSAACLCKFCRKEVTASAFDGHVYCQLREQKHSLKSWTDIYQPTKLQCWIG